MEPPGKKGSYVLHVSVVRSVIFNVSPSTWGCGMVQKREQLSHRLQAAIAGADLVELLAALVAAQKAGVSQDS